MDRNTVAAIVLSTLVIIGGFTLQSKLFPPQNPSQPGATADSAQKNEGSVIAESEVVASLDAPVGETVASGELLSPEGSTVAPIVEETYTIETDLVSVTFTNKGGDIVSYKLKQHSDRQNQVEMAESVTANNRAFSILLGAANGEPLDQLFNVKRISDTEIGFYRVFTVKNADGSLGRFTLAKQYSFVPGDYMFELKVMVDGDSSLSGLRIGDAAYTIRTSPQIGPDWNAKQDRYEFRKFFYLLNGKKKTVTVNQGQSKTNNEKFTWASVAGKYFTLIAVPESPIQGVVFSGKGGTPEAAISQMFLTRSPISGNKNTDIWRFYLGPRTGRHLAKYNLAVNNPYGLDDAKLNEMVESSGFLAPLEWLLKVVMELFYKVIPNWGVSIILLTILMRIIIFPLTKKSSESTLKMQEHAPKMQELQEKYKGNPQKLNEEMAKFYQASGYNPISGCLPLLIQFPLIFAMYNLFNNYFEFRGAMFIPGWIPDLSQGDSVLLFPFTVPFVGWNELRILPIIYVISQLLFGKVTQTPTTSQQNSTMKFMMYGMPLIFFFMFYNAPAGLLLYWILSNVLTLGQQVVINRMMHAKKAQGLQLVKK